jgi:hypothetical protein
MKCHRETILACEPALVWREVQRVALLEEIAAPLVRFRLPAGLPATWPAGETVRLRSYLFGLIPLGERTLTFERVDHEAMEIQTRERDPLIQTWDHLIAVKPAPGGHTRYSDTVEIGAGIFTLPVWLFAHWFYRHRQRRWRWIAARLAAA